MEKIKVFLKSETVLVISTIAVIVTMFFVPPSTNYLSYIDFRVLTLLFCLMAVVSGFQKIGVFAVLSQKFISGAKNTRGLCLVLVLLCYFSSMLITNDVALLTFVPFTILVLGLTGQTSNLIPLIVLQTVAANLGSMLTPVGNPQNLYLYSFYNINIVDFFKITLPISAVSLVLIIATTLLQKGNNINVEFKKNITITSKKELVIYITLFLLCLTTVFHLIHYLVTLVVVCATIFIADKKLFKAIDFGLLATFVCFFIFVGSISDIDSARSTIAKLIQGRELFSVIVLSQVISNVPAAVLLSSFTNDSKALLIGSNIGGLGTIIASLASLISFKLYVKTENAKPLYYLFVFTIVNVTFLAAMVAFTFLII